jgi:hypothetical protein
MSQNRMAGGKQSPANEAGMPKFKLNEFAFSHLGELESAWELQKLPAEFEIEE